MATKTENGIIDGKKYYIGKTNEEHFNESWDVPSFLKDKEYKRIGWVAYSNKNEYQLKELYEMNGNHYYVSQVNIVNNRIHLTTCDKLTKYFIIQYDDPFFEHYAIDFTTIYDGYRNLTVTTVLIKDKKDQRKISVNLSSFDDVKNTLTLFTEGA